MPLGKEFCRTAIAGVAEYCELHTRMHVSLRDGSSLERNGFENDGASWDGIISAAVSPDLWRQFIASALPVVACEPLPHLGCPLVYPDHKAVGRLAAEHFVELGHRSLVHLSLGAPFSHDQADGMREVAAQAGAKVRSIPLPAKGAEEFVDKIPKPFACLCTDMGQARHVIAACTSLGVAVPDEVAVMAVGEDDVFCLLERPHMSTVSQGAKRVGFEAARIMDGMLRGDKPPQAPVLVEPDGVIVRQSTDAVVIEDPTVAQAMNFIRSYAPEGISVPDVLQEVPLGRRALEKRFRAVVGRSIYQQIIHERMAHGKKLLLATDLAIIDVAVRCGMSSASDFIRLFARQYGQTPEQYRRDSKSGQT
jgi:LacI family transcriptional regulator